MVFAEVSYNGAPLIPSPKLGNKGIKGGGERGAISPPFLRN
jgi:hypothetical protein